MALEKELKSNLQTQGEEPANISQETKPVEPIPLHDAENPIPMEIPAETFAPANPDPVPPVADHGENRPEIAKLEKQMEAVSDQMTSVVVPAVRRIETNLSAMNQQPSSALEERISALEKVVTSLEQKQDQQGKYLIQDLRDNNAFKIQVRQGMQHDIDELKKVASGAVFDSILKEIATVYSDYYFLLDEEMPARLHSNIEAFLSQLEELLEQYDCEVFRSKVGEPRRVRMCKCINKVMTGDESMHNTVAKSYRPGVQKDRIVFCPETVDVFCYDPNLAPAAQEAPQEETPAEQETPLTQELPDEATVREESLPEQEPVQEEKAEMLPETEA